MSWLGDILKRLAGRGKPARPAAPSAAKPLTREREAILARRARQRQNKRKHR